MPTLSLFCLAIARAEKPTAQQEMVRAAEALLQSAEFEEIMDSTARFTVAAESADADAERLGVYGEMPLSSIAEVLEHPVVRRYLPSDGSATFVDYGSGTGRLLLGTAAMHNWRSAVGIEAIEALHAIASEAVRKVEASKAIAAGVVRSVHATASSLLPHEDASVAAALAECDLLFMYSTAFPAEDGLRLPELSASLACTLPAGSLVVTTDKFLVGDRFVFEALVPLLGENNERIHGLIWRVTGPPPAPAAADRGYAVELGDVHARFMGEDATNCTFSPDAANSPIMSAAATASASPCFDSGTSRLPP